MALRGTLEDMGVIELVQFPHQGKRTGELIVVGPEHEARLYYEKGKLVHAATHDKAGQEVLEQVVDWAEGDFEFRPNVEAPETSIETDLHRSVMLALKTRDEKKMEEKKEERKEKKTGPEPRQKEEQKDTEKAPPSPAGLENMLEEFVSAADAVLHAGVVDAEGNNMAAANNGADDGERGKKLTELLQKALNSHPRPGISRIITEDDNGIGVMLNLDGKSSLVVAAQKNAALGAVSISAGKLARKLKQSL